MDIHNEILVSGSLDKKIQVWNLETNRKLFEVAHDSVVWSVKIVNERFLSCGDKTVRIWSLKDGKLLHILSLSDWCHSFDLNSEKTLLAVADATEVSIWDFSNLVKIKSIELSETYDVRFNEPGNKLIIGQNDGQVSIIDLY